MSQSKTERPVVIVTFYKSVALAYLDKYKNLKKIFDEQKVCPVDEALVDLGEMLCKSAREDDD